MLVIGTRAVEVSAMSAAAACSRAKGFTGKGVRHRGGVAGEQCVGVGFAGIRLGRHLGVG
jgi:hypothetical protein